MGGYFIVNGNEKLLRMLIMPRRNYVSYVVLCIYLCVDVDSQYDVCSSVTTGIAIETFGSICIRIEPDPLTQVLICFYCTSSCDTRACVILRTHLTYNVYCLFIFVCSL